MCQHDKEILKKLEGIERLALETREVAERNISTLKDQITTHTEFTRDKLESIEKNHDKEFQYLKEELGEIKTETKLTNSRVNKLEKNQSVCLVNTLGKDFEDYKRKMKPIYLVATSWKMILGIAVVFGVVMTLGNAAIQWAYQLIGINPPG